MGCLWVILRCESVDAKYKLTQDVASESHYCKQVASLPLIHNNVCGEGGESEQQEGVEKVDVKNCV